MEIAILTAIHGRHELVKEFISKGDNARMKIYAVVSTDEDVQFCKDNNITYTIAPNNPLANKWQEGLMFARKFNWDGLLILGSDDIFYGLDAYKEYLKDYDFIAVEDCYVQNYKTGETRYWEGYTNHRKGEPVGTGRCFSRDLLIRMNWDLWIGAGNNGLDGMCWGKMKNYEYTSKILRNEVKIVALKGDKQLTPFEKFRNLKEVKVDKI